MNTIQMRYEVLRRAVDTLEALSSTAEAWAASGGESDQELAESLSIAHAAALRAKAEAHLERIHHANRVKLSLTGPF